MTTYRLDTSGPHSDDYTRHAAEAFAAAVRVLNHATRTSEGVTEPNTVNDVLGNASAAIASLDQLFNQLYQQLNNMHAAGQLGDDSGHPARELRATRTALSDARQTARMLAGALRFAQQTTSGMHLRGGDD